LVPTYDAKRHQQNTLPVQSWLFDAPEKYRSTGTLHVEENSDLTKIYLFKQNFHIHTLGTLVGQSLFVENIEID